MGRIMKSSFDAATETRPFADGTGYIETVDLDGSTVGRAVFEPGWRWSQHVRPLAGTDSCQVAHYGYLISGALTVRMDDGAQETFGAGDIMIVPPGHDAWVEGASPCVMLDWQGAVDYARPSSIDLAAAERISTA